MNNSRRQELLAPTWTTSLTNQVLLRLTEESKGNQLLIINNKYRHRHLITHKRCRPQPRIRRNNKFKLALKVTHLPFTKTISPNWSLATRTRNWFSPKTKSRSLRNWIAIQWVKVLPVRKIAVEAVMLVRKTKNSRQLLAIIFKWRHNYH